MYIFANSIISILRNKGRNILIGIIILVIACASTVTLAIRNTAINIVKNYEEANDIIATISFNRKNLTNNFQGGKTDRKQNIEAFNNIEQITIDNVKSYGQSNYLKGYYYLYATSLNSDSIAKATDSYEYEAQDILVPSTTTNNMPQGESSGKVVTKAMGKIENNRNFTGDFEIDGYSSYDAMTDFVSGNYNIIDGTMISNFTEMECVINSELASLNEIKVGNTIDFINPNTGVTYKFTVVGIYEDNTNTDDITNMYSNSVNKIITGSGVVEKLVLEDNTLVTNITPSFILLNEESIQGFEEEVKEKGLSEYYSINTNLDQLKDATKSISNVKTFATTFLLITLAISAIILFIINMINIRERKYEIGVFRTIGVSKFKLTMQFLLELMIVAIIMLFIGAGCGAFAAKPIGNYLLQNEITQMENSNEQISNNFGRDKVEMQFGKGVQINAIDSIDAVVDYVVIFELLGIGIALTLVSSISSMISIQRFSPLTILKERS